MTPEEADERSAYRAKMNARRVITLAIFTFLSVLVLAYLAQVQIATNRQAIRVGAAALHQMCLERQVNIKRTNDSWGLLSAIEKREPLINADIRNARLKIYRDARLTVPNCP